LERLIHTAAAAACSLTILAGAVGCSAAGHPSPAEATTRSAGPPGPAVSVRPVKAEPAAENDPAQLLSVPGHQKVLYRTQGRRGAAHLTVLPRIPRGTLGIVVLCNGPGRILVHLGDIASFDASCGTGPGVYNEIVLDGARRSVAVSVTGSNQNEWALTLGWTSVIKNPF
jgi:hypothetical protein